METYQAIYDAVRSKISSCDLGDAARQAISDSGLSHEISLATYEFKLSANAMRDPSVLLRPKLFIDGDMWCALYGENIQDGVAGFGKSPSEALEDFNLQMHTELN